MARALTLLSINLALVLMPAAGQQQQAQETQLNDVHSRLNPTRVGRIVAPRSAEEVVNAVRQARREGMKISISGSRHSMGGQQFLTDGLHLDMTQLKAFLALDKEKGLARVQAGINWIELRQALEAAQVGEGQPWSITQKQTGADDLTLGGAVSSNIHGRGLTWQPFVQDIESLTLVAPDARVLKLSRLENPEFFRLVVGGYGLFGVITEVELRLRRQEQLERVVEVAPLAGIPERIAERVKEGYLLGDFQFCPDEKSDRFLQEGVFACYRPVQSQSAAGASRLALGPEAWRRLIIKAHADKSGAWHDYKSYYLKTHGQVYASDLAQFNHYDRNYEELIRQALPDIPQGSLMISEVYVPVHRLVDFMKVNAQDFRKYGTNVIYGTIRFIRRDDVTFLPWAREDFACIVFNLRVNHDEPGIAKARGEFQRLISRALEREGSFFLTYHRWATKEQMLKAYPQFPDFLRLKKQYDPDEIFQSDWYRHWKKELQMD